MSENPYEYYSKLDRISGPGYMLSQFCHEGLTLWQREDRVWVAEVCSCSAESDTADKAVKVLSILVLERARLGQEGC